MDECDSKGLRSIEFKFQELAHGKYVRDIEQVSLKKAAASSTVMGSLKFLLCLSIYAALLSSVGKNYDYLQNKLLSINFL